MEKRSAPTLDTVAARAGVGRGTVSRVITGSAHVSQKTREAVNRAIAELGYVPNHAARSLVTRRTDMVALVISETEERMWGEPYFADVIRGISRQLSETGLRLMLTLASTVAERERLQGYLLGNHVDGVLMISLHGEDPLPNHLAGRGVPVVLCGAPVGSSTVPYVDSDNRGGARHAVEHLLETGRRRIAVIAGTQDMSVGMDRLTGYREALRSAGIAEDAELIEYGDFSEAAGVSGTRNLLARVPDLDAIFAASDPMAFGALRVLRERGLRVPDDVAVVGFDDSPRAEYSEPPLTTVRQAAEAMGREMARLLCARMAGDDPEPPSTVLSTRLIVRGSS